jgi:hypothetical protein
MKTMWYKVYPAIVAPLLLAITSLFLGFTRTGWAFLSLPFIYLGSICAAPNMNLANGFLAMLAMLLGLAVCLFNPAIGLPIFLGTSASWLLSSLEMCIRAQPLKDGKADADRDKR